ncbi:cAMP-specific 3',5'-cyclic phosphodiesterase [Hondaea fermentalgiana]|uniref:Phosphodiesterase n=1 Tax=Hondaea fermentalgiana TaxID=2315210 RepID=A0A2R5G8Z7_9STRA|nr:cAMP-specific 3',5'-cyclic phosphodiesterase [Hondaea fermentalgiana]|eukprot:GBG26248.1 cAMP-specific 3',5'-cyclic phosphodiesterase [Hondaea fermentalgiana]
MRYIELLASYLPSVVVDEILKLEEEERQTKERYDSSQPRLTNYDAACLFADVSGFTKLSERMSFRYGPHVGAEHLAKQLNSYFSQLVKIINSEGGDVFKFAGDAMIVLWPPTGDEESIEDRAKRATQCAVRIQGLGQDLTFDDDAVSLSIKIGVGVGSLAIIHLGGIKGRTEYVAVGEPMSQAFAAEGMASAGDVIVSSAAWKCIEKEAGISGDKMPGGKRGNRHTGFRRIDLDNFRPGRARNKRVGVNLFDAYTGLTEERIRQLIPSAALQSIDSAHPEFEYYSSELRRISVVFIGLGLTEAEVQAAATGGEEMQVLHEAMRIVQTAAYKYEGALNKFIVDDKGATIIVLFGLPPYSHENDAKRAVSSSLHSISRLRENLGLNPAAGITSGTAFCGVLGSQTRKEYSVLGDIVNLSARFMQASRKSLDEGDSMSFIAPIICDEATFVTCQRDIPFRRLEPIRVKGKSKPIKAFEPLASAGLLAAPQVPKTTMKRTLRIGIGRRDRGETRQRAASDIASANGKEFSVRDSMQLLGPRFPMAGLTPKGSTSKAPPGGHVAMRFSSIILLAPERLRDLEESTGRKNEDLRMYFRMPTSLLRGRGPGQRKRNASGAQSDRRRSSSMSSRGLRTSQRLASALAGAVSSSPSSGGKASASSVAEVIEEDADFEFNNPAASTNRKTYSSLDSDEGTHGLRRKSLIFYNEVANTAHVSTGGPSDPEYDETCAQVVIGAPKMYHVATIDRGSGGRETTKDLLANACERGHSVGMLQHGIGSDHLALIIQGTEMVFNLDIWPSNTARIEAALNGKSPTEASEGVPLKYLEPIVNTALGFGVLWQRSVDIRPAKDLKRADAPRRAPSVGSVSAPLYNCEEVSSGTTLTLVLVARKDVAVLQSPNSYVLGALMARKIELIEHNKGSVAIVTGEPGSGKTNLLKHFGYGFLPEAVPVLGSSEQWEHTTSEYERLFQLNGESDQFQKFRNEERHFHVWFDIILQWIFHEASDLAAATLRKNPGKIRTQILAGALDDSLAGYASLLNDDLGTEFDEADTAALLSDLPESERVAHVNEVLTDMICDIVSKIVIKFGGLVVLIDDALRLDEHSWGVARRLAELVCSDSLELLLVVALRSFEGLTDRTMGLQPRLIQPRTRAALVKYREVCAVEGVEVLSMGPLSRNMAVDIFRKHVGDDIQTVSPDLWRMCESRCYNNPLLISDFAYEIREARRPKIVRYTPLPNTSKKPSKRNQGADAPRQLYTASLRVAVQHLDEPAWTMHAAHRAALSKQAAFLADRSANDPMNSSPDQPAQGINENEMEGVNFPPDYYPPAEVAPPRTAAGVLGELVDRLGSIEQMVLRIACMIGSTFSLRLIQDVYPRNSLKRDFTENLVKAACENLADQHGIFHKVRANAYNDEYVYRFADMLLVSTLRHRLLKKHKISLAASITRARSQFKAALELEKLQAEDSALPKRPVSMRVLTTAGDPQQARIEKEGPLSIKKKNPPSNKIFSDWKERYVVLHADCILIFKKRDPRRMAESDAHVVIYLNEASVELFEDPAERTHTLAFRIIADEWSRRGELHYSMRDFTFADSDPGETRRWFSRVSMTLNRHKLGTRFFEGANSSNNSRDLLPVRRRTILNFASLLNDGDTGIVVTLRSAGPGASHEQFSSSRTPRGPTKHLSSPNNHSTEIYASAFIRLHNGVRFVRKQTMLTAPTHSELLEFNESFLFKLAPEFLVDWRNQPERNASLEIVLWRQLDSALGFDMMVGYCSVQLADVYIRRDSASKLSLDLDVIEPYGDLKAQDATLSVGLELVINGEDETEIATMQESISLGEPSRDHNLEQQRELADIVFQENMELNVRSETGRQGGSFADTTGSGRGTTLQRPQNKKKKSRGTGPPLEPLALNGTLAPGEKRSTSMQISRPRMISTATQKSRRATLVSESGASNKGALVSPLAHLEFVAKAARNRGERDLLGVLKRLLLTRSFAELVSPVSLDEKSRKWLGSQFTRAEVRPDGDDDALGEAVRRFSLASAPSASGDLAEQEESATSLEFLANAYVQACGRPLDYVDEETATPMGPVSLAAVLSRMNKGVSPMTEVGIYSDPESHEASDRMPLVTYLDELRTQALEVARAAIGRRLEDDGKGRSAVPNAVFQRSTSSSTLTSNGAGAGGDGGIFGGRSGSLVFSTTATMAAVAAAAAARKKKKQPRRRKKKAESWNSMISRYGKFVGKEKISDPRLLDPSSWFFDLSLVPTNFRTYLVAHMFRIMSIDTQFAVPTECFVSFVERVESAMSMHNTPYHNFDHACDVLQATFVMLTSMQGVTFLDEVQAFGLMIAAFCHDLEHPGLNNAFQVKAETKLAKMYEGRSVLESHHCACAFGILQDDSSNILRNMNETEASDIRQIVLECILATDMTCHFDLTGELRDCIVRHLDDPTTSMNEEERGLVAKSILHCADISNPTRSWDISKRWQDLICEEFYAQGDLERANGWEVSPNMDRETTHQAEMSINFIDFIVAPLFFAMSTLLPNSSDPCIQVAANRSQWMELLQDEVMTRQDLDEESREATLRDWDAREVTFEQVLSSAGFADGLKRSRGDTGFTEDTCEEDDSMGAGTGERHGPDDGDFGTISRRKGSNAAVAYIDVTDVRPPSPQPSL